MITQFKTLKANSGSDIIIDLDGTSYGPGSPNWPMQVNQHPWVSPDGVSIVISGGYGSSENATFQDGTGTNYTVTSNPAIFVEINEMPFTILS